MNDVKSRVIAIVTGKTLPEAIKKVSGSVPAETGEVTVAVVKEDCYKDLTVRAGHPIPVVETTTYSAPTIPLTDSFQDGTELTAEGSREGAILDELAAYRLGISFQAYQYIKHLERRLAAVERFARGEN